MRRRREAADEQKRDISRHTEPVMPPVHVFQAAEQGRQARFAQDQEKAGDEHAASGPSQDDSDLTRWRSPFRVSPEHETQHE
jgi:hypothetical protein